MSCTERRSISEQICFSNIELVTNICKFLNYKEQYQLQKVCKNLNNIIINYIWKKKYKEVEIITNENEILVVNKINTLMRNRINSKLNIPAIIETNCVILNKYELNNFLSLNVNNINRLYIEAGEPLIGMLIIRNPLIKKQLYKNLNYICFYKLTLTNEDMKNLSENCKNLRELILKQNLNEEGDMLLLDIDIELETIKSMLQLEKLTINDYIEVQPFSLEVYRFSNILKILNQLKLKYLILNIMIYSDNNTFDDYEFYDFNNLKYIEVFQIGIFHETNDYINFQINILPKFQNLHNLSLRNVTITNKFFNILLNNHINLTHLTLNKCYIEEFIALPHLQELNLIACRGLNGSIMKIILQEMHLTNFSSFNSEFNDNLEMFAISSTLENLEFYNIDNNFPINVLQFQTKPLENLKKFIWQLPQTSNYNFFLSKLMPNLNCLNIMLPGFNIKQDLCNLKFLQKIMISYGFDITLSKLQEFLLLKNLNELSLSKVNNCLLDRDLSKLKAFETPVQYLDIPWCFVETKLDFFLDLLCLNKNLSLICSDLEVQSLVSILTNLKFHRYFNSINICGLSIGNLEF